MQTFRVTWEIDIEADTATVFTCVDPECKATVVDLDEEDGGLS